MNQAALHRGAVTKCVFVSMSVLVSMAVCSPLKSPAVLAVPVVPVCTLQCQELAALCSAGLEVSCARRTTGIAGGSGDYRRNLGC
jgi:hypothetical protein